MSNEINLVEYEKEIGLFLKGQKTPNKKETNKKGDANFQIASKATKQKFKKYDFILFENKMLYK